MQGFSTQSDGVYPAWDRFGRTTRHMWVDGDYTQLSGSTTFPDRPPLFEITHSYDRSSNRLTRYDERPGAQMPNWDFEYDYDGLDRLVGADRGEIEGSTFTSGIGVQEWTLDILGNWETIKQDLDGDGNFTDNKEDEDRSHNQANEITSLDINGLAGTPFTQHRDKAGNWTRNRWSAAFDTRYTHDAWNRLVKVERGTVPVATDGEYEYNGLHWRTTKQFPNNGTTEERRLFYSASWQLLEERIDSDTSGGFTEEKCAQTVWGLRYIDDAVLRRMDTNQDYDYADTGERNDYYFTDPQFSVCAVVDSTGKLQERLAYSAYGEATHHFPADMDGDGDVDSTDTMWFTNLNNLKDIDESGYNPDGDLNRDGTVNTQDLLLAFGWNGSAALAKGLISDPDGPDSPIGYDGYLFNAETELYTVRFRHYEPVTGRWIERDPLGVVALPIPESTSHAVSPNSASSASAVQGSPVELSPFASSPIPGRGAVWFIGVSSTYSYADGMSLIAYGSESPTSATDILGLDLGTIGGGSPEERKRRTEDQLRRKKCQMQESCREWVAKELKNMRWLRPLPNCPCSLTKVGGTWVNPNAGAWNDPSSGAMVKKYHPGAAACMRSKANAFGGGQQCCYSGGGSLITHGEGAGTPDKASSTYNVRKHYFADVAPFDTCKAAGMIDEYLKARPPNNGRGCASNP